MSRRSLIAPWLILLGLAGSSGACRREPSPSAQPAAQTGAPQTDAAQPAANQPGSNGTPVCETHCSPDKERTAVAVITWTLAEPAGEAAAFASRMAAQSLEVTVYKDGFDKGVFVRVAGVSEKREFSPAAAAASAGQTIPGLQSRQTCWRDSTIG